MSKVKLDPKEKGITITKKDESGTIVYGDTNELVVFSIGEDEEEAVVNDDFGDKYNIYISGDIMEKTDL